jgi:putative membrane protein insertion efficiency factor
MDDGPGAAGRSERAALAAIRWYQGLRAGQPSPCRYWPSCSEYALEAVERHGVARGGWLAVRRVARCHPLGGRGVDLVPVEVHGTKGTHRCT